MTKQPLLDQEDNFSDAFEFVLLRVIFEKKWTLLICSFLVGVLVAAYSLTKPNIYEAKAALTVQQEKSPLDPEEEGDSKSGFNIEILQRLTESTDVKKQLYENLRNTNQLPEDMTFETFTRRMETGVQQETGIQKNLLPILELKVQSPDMDLAQTIANAWSDTVLEQTQRIYTTDIKAQSDFIQPVFEEADRTLLQNEDRYTSARLEAQTAVKRETLTRMQQTYSEAYAEWLNLQSQHKIDKALYSELGSLLNKQEVGGVWVGDALWETYRNNGSIDFTLESPKSKRLAEVIQEIIRNEEALAAMERQSELDFMQMDLKNKERQLEEVSVGILQAQNKMSRMQEEYKIHQQSLKQISQKTSYTKALTNDVLFQAALDNQLQKRDLPVLIDEEENPVYTEIQTLALKMAADITGVQKQAKYFEDKRESLKQEVAEMSSDITRLEARRDTLLNALSSQKKALEEMREEYNIVRQQVEKLETKIPQTEVSLKVMDEEITTLQENIAALEESIFRGEDLVEQRHREVEDVKTVRSSLATRKQEIALLQITAAQSARSGVKLLYAAQTNPQKVAPSRSKMVLAAMLATFFLLAIWVVLDFLLKNSAQVKQEPAA